MSQDIQNNQEPATEVLVANSATSKQPINEQTDNSQANNVQLSHEQGKPKKQKEKKTKKKHGFLKFLLITAIVIASIVGIKLLSNKLAANRMNKFVSDYPFEFKDDTNRIHYITDDFKVTNSYSTGKKDLHTRWTSDDKCLVIDENGMVTVTRPTDASRRVTLTETYRQFPGKAKRTFEVVVIPTNVLDAASVDVITLEELRNDEYNRDMQAVLDAEGNLDYMLGDFKNTFAYSHDDALVLLELYRTEFQAGSEASFIFDRVVDTDFKKVYYFDVYCNDYKVEGCSAEVVVDSYTFKVNKIDINARLGNVSTVSENTSLDYETIIQEYITANDPLGAAEEYRLLEGENKIVDERYVKSYRCFFRSGAIYEIDIDVQTGEVIRYFTGECTADYQEADCNSTDDYGNDFEFEASKTRVVISHKEGIEETQYILYDKNRNIQVLDNNGFWKISEYLGENIGDDPYLIQVAGAIPMALDYYISKNMNFAITSDSPTFEQGAEAKVFYNMQVTYDWYQNNCGLTSYDDAGAPIVVLTDCGRGTDNAAWLGDEKVFYVYKVDAIRYPLGNNTDIMAHEYTHAVVGNMTNLDSGSGLEAAGLNEAYADIFSSLITDDWVFGEIYTASGSRVYCRDLQYVNRPAGDSLQPYKGEQYPVTYMDENWQNEEHNIATVIGHVGYNIWASGYFSEAQFTEIWFKSLGYGYNGDSNFLTCRKFVIQAAKDLGYSAEQVDCIAYEFSQAGIYDDSYEYESLKFQNAEELAGAFDTIKAESDAVEGDLILDDTTINQYVIVYSPVSIVFGNGEGVFIYQVKNDATNEEIEEVSEVLSERFDAVYGEYNLQGYDIQVEYRQINQFGMNIVEKFCTESSDRLRSISYDALEIDGSGEDDESKELIDTFMRFAFNWKVVDSTAYDFYDSFGVIE